MSWSLRSTNTSKPLSVSELTASGPAAVNSSRPTLATPNHGGTGQAATGRTETQVAALGIYGHGHDGVDECQSVGAGAQRGAGNLGEVGDVGTQLRPARTTARGGSVERLGSRRRRVGEHLAA